MALAITSLPVPVSPWIRTAESTGATLSTSWSKARNFALDPIKSKVVIFFLFPQIKSLLSAFTSLPGDPLADVRIAVHQRNTGGFALSKKSYAILTCQGHILEVENDMAIFPFRADERFQLGNVLFVEPATQRKDHVPVPRPLNSQHCFSWRVRMQASCHRNLLKIN